MLNQIKETIGKKYAHQIILEVTKKPKNEKDLDGEFDVIEKYIFTLGIDGSPETQHKHLPRCYLLVCFCRMSVTEFWSTCARIPDNTSGSPTLEVESDTSSKVCRNKVEIKQRSGTLIRGLVTTLAGLEALQKVGSIMRKFCTCNCSCPYLSTFY